MKKFYLLLLFLVIFSNVAFGEENRRRSFNFGFITPVSTNGIESGRTINAVSVNLFGGYSYANEYFELGGLYNVNRTRTSGVSLAGLFSYSGCLYKSFQVSGLFNYGKTGTAFLQLAGVMNRSENVKGMQVSGLLNVADKLSGVQIGLVNIVDESDNGVSLGLINIVRKGGKMDFSLALSDAVNTSVDFRIGKDNFYTIFTGGVSYLGTPLEYTAGIGFGSGFGMKKGWSCFFEALANSFTREGSFNNEFRLNPQFRILFDKRLSRHLSLYFGPVFNAFVDDKLNDNDFPLQKSLSLFEKNGSEYKVSGWIGFNLGLRIPVL